MLLPWSSRSRHQGNTSSFSIRVSSFLLQPLTSLLYLSTFVSADDPGKGYHSEYFDHTKYGALRDLLITPETHPHLFSFTGRWARSHEIFYATKWPGNSFTALIFGESCSIKVRPRTGQGYIPRYSYFISIDGGEEFRYDLPGFDSGKTEEKNIALFVPIRFDLEKVKEENANENQKAATSGESKKDRRHLQKRSIGPDIGVAIEEKRKQQQQKQQEQSQQQQQEQQLQQGQQQQGQQQGQQQQEQQQQAPAEKKKKLKPHTIRITSIPETPFSFEGLLIHNTQIRQGWDWHNVQNERLRVEFVGEGADAETPGGMGLSGFWVQDPKEGNPNRQGELEWHRVGGFTESVQWKAAERLKLRHWHISAGVCLLSGCDPKNPLPGLSKQYFQLNPMNHSLPFDPDPKGIPNTSPEHPSNQLDQWFFNARQPWVPEAPPTHVIVDVGIPDLIIFKQDPEKYKHELLFFLAKIRARAHPDAKILVVGRKGDAGSILTKKTATHSKVEDPSEKDSVIPNTPENTLLRQHLYEITKSAVEIIQIELGDKNIAFMSIDVTAGSANAEMDLTRALCRDLVPPAPLLDNILRTAGGKDGVNMVYDYKLSHAQFVCAELKAGMHRRDWIWGIVLLGLAVGMSLVAKETVTGAVQAVLETCFGATKQQRKDDVSGASEELLLGERGKAKGKGKANEKLG